MTNEEIKTECESIYEKFTVMEERLKVIRSTCKHEITFTANYSERPGSFELSEICSFCGEFIRICDESIPKSTLTVSR